VDELSRIYQNRRLSDECLSIAGEPLLQNIGDFWAWSNLDIISNTTCGILAEHIVRPALDAFGIKEGVREEWAAYDLRDPRGIDVLAKLHVATMSY